MSVTATPTSVFVATWEAVRYENWDAVLPLMDPDSLALFKLNWEERLSFDNEDRVTVEMLMRYSPDMPREAAEYQVRQRQKYSDVQRMLGDDLPGIDTLQQLRNASPQDVFVAWLKGRAPDHQLKRLIEFGDVPAHAAVYGADFPKPSLHVVGELQAGEEFCYIAFRTIYTPPETDEQVAAPIRTELTPEQLRLHQFTSQGPPHLSLCRKQPDGSWRVVADDNFVGYGNLAIGFDPVDEET
jgi:hypothetical protein